MDPISPTKVTEARQELGKAANDADAEEDDGWETDSQVDYEIYSKTVL